MIIEHRRRVRGAINRHDRDQFVAGGPDRGLIVGPAQPVIGSRGHRPQIRCGPARPVPGSPAAQQCGQRGAPPGHQDQDHQQRRGRGENPDHPRPVQERARPQQSHRGDKRDDHPRLAQRQAHRKHRFHCWLLDRAMAANPTTTAESSATAPTPPRATHTGVISRPTGGGGSTSGVESRGGATASPGGTS